MNSGFVFVLEGNACRCISGNSSGEVHIRRLSLSETSSHDADFSFAQGIPVLVALPTASCLWVELPEKLPGNVQPEQVRFLAEEFTPWDADNTLVLSADSQRSRLLVTQRQPLLRLLRQLQIQKASLAAVVPASLLIARWRCAASGNNTTSFSAWGRTESVEFQGQFVQHWASDLHPGPRDDQDGQATDTELLKAAEWFWSNRSARSEDFLKEPLLHEFSNDTAAAWRQRMLLTLGVCLIIGTIALHWRTSRLNTIVQTIDADCDEALEELLPKLPPQRRTLARVGQESNRLRKQSESLKSLPRPILPLDRVSAVLQQPLTGTSVWVKAITVEPQNVVVEVEAEQKDQIESWFSQLHFTSPSDETELTSSSGGTPQASLIVRTQQSESSR